LIEGLGSSGVEVLLFGPMQQKITYSQPSIKVLAFSSKFHAMVLLFKWMTCLAIFKPSQLVVFFRLFYRTKQSYTLRSLVQYLGVLWHKPDVFHIQWAKSLEQWMWVQEFGIKIVLSLRGAHINYSPIAERTLDASYRRSFPKVDGFHAVSLAIGKTATKYGAPLKKIKVIYSGMDLGSLPFNTMKKKRDNTLKILSVGRSHWIKGYSYALDACQLLTRQRIPFEYTIIGGLAEEYIFQVNQLGLSEAVTLTDNIPFERVVQHMQEADVLLLPSVEEGIANVALEAMAIGLPVICTRCGGMDEAIKNGENGYLVDIRNPVQIADTLTAFYNIEANVLAALVVNARATVEQQFELSRMADDMVTLYREVLNLER
jgi:glycosyltransferase involved in cell wall biosynthesis